MKSFGFTIELAGYFLSALGYLALSPGKAKGDTFKDKLLFLFIRRLLMISRSQPIPWLRHRHDKIRRQIPYPDNTEFKSEQIEGVPCLWCMPLNKKNQDGLIIFIHGGGYVMGSSKAYRSFMAYLMNKTGMPVLGIDYHLAPEHQYPTAHENVLVVVKTILGRYPQSSIMLAGDSAGGALCISTLISLREEGSAVLPQAAFLFSPWISPSADPENGEALNDTRFVIASVAKQSSTSEKSTGARLLRRFTPRNDGNREDNFLDILDLELLERWSQTYFGETEKTNSAIDLLTADLRGLPPLFIQAAEEEILVDQIRAFADKARLAGVEVSLDVFKNRFHAFQTLIPYITGADEALNRVRDQINELMQRTNESRRSEINKQDVSN